MRAAFIPFVLMALISFAMSMLPLRAIAGDAAILQIITQADGAEIVRDVSLSDLQDIGQDGFVTSTIWTDGDIEFQGVTATALLHHLGIASGALELIAANDYFVEIPVGELQNNEALIAYKMNGMPMSTRDKGPFWLVYPYDSDVRYQSETYYARSIWQINRIKVIP